MEKGHHPMNFAAGLNKLPRRKFELKFLQRRLPKESFAGCGDFGEF